mmetsp:Transcript_10455/g.28628  ORF Transcript_10455/g.28628 Transcript_10455/m.28628 type:complete len:223 (-) Transcript_10455:2268-2936(-)
MHAIVTLLSTTGAMISTSALSIDMFRNPLSCNRSAIMLSWGLMVMRFGNEAMTAGSSAGAGWCFSTLRACFSRLGALVGAKSMLLSMSLGSPETRLLGSTSETSRSMCLKRSSTSNLIEVRIPSRLYTSTSSASTAMVHGLGGLNATEVAQGSIRCRTNDRMGSIIPFEYALRMFCLMSMCFCSTGLLQPRVSLPSHDPRFFRSVLSLLLLFSNSLSSMTLQ